MVKNIGIALAVVIVVLAVVISFRPAEFRVTREAAFDAPAPVVFAQVNDLHKWQAWSPWAKMDPLAKESFEGPMAATGAKMSWSGNNKVGEGSMTITDSRPNEMIRFKLVFVKPFAATNTAEFSFHPQGKQTLVSWTMFGPNNFMGKAIGLVMDCDKMIGGQFEQGLANLKAVVESEKKPK